MKRKVCAVTGSRAEYGLLRPLLEELKTDRDLKLQIMVTGMHLSSDFDLTYREIQKNGFVIDKRIKILQRSDDPLSISDSIGLAIKGFTRAYRELKPDIVVVLGDRYEIFSAATAAMVSMIPIAHLNGGERTEGSMDEAMRHSITKMSHLHFTSTEEYRKRVIQLGEEPRRVFNVGALGIDNIKKLRLLTKDELEKKINFKFNNIHNLLIAFHPTTLEGDAGGRQFQNLLNVLNDMVKTNFIFTKSNADTGGRAINRLIDKYVSKNSHRAVSFISLGQLNFLSMMQFIDAIVGNSSSGIIEAPSFKIGTINIGDRQKGRIRTESIIDCEPARGDIVAAFRKLYSKEFQRRLKNVKNPYGDGNAAERIKTILKSYDINGILKKPFYNLSL